MINIDIPKIIMIIISIFFILFFSGCIEYNPDKNFYNNYTNLPSISIKAPKEAYFGETIEFDVSYDKSKFEISSFQWNFQDGAIAKGKNVEHKFKLEDNFNVEYPVIYTVTVFIRYKDALDSAIHRIKLYPRELTLYLQKNNLSINIPSSSKEKITDKIFSIFDQKEFSYTFDKKVYLDECTWSASLYFKKPFLSNIKEIKIILYDENGLKFEEEKVNQDFINLGKKKTVTINGEIHNDYTFKSMKLVISSFSLNKDFYLSYGDGSDSKICFRFNN